ncbi:MAG: type VI secretion system tube protein Hcp [Candidatus Omnitrophica bacterium]|nr:type VI secretion system tube protein Hcp [Candidatus Omnitrophota bacterium]
MKGMPVSRLMLLVFVFVSVVLMLGPVRAEAAKKISGSVGKGGKTKVTGIFPEIGEINLTMLNWGFAADDPAAARAGVVLEEIEVEKEVDRTSVPLVQACAGGRSFPEVVIVWNTGTGDEPSYLELRLYSVKVTSYSVNGSGLDDGSIPTETLSLNFDKITWSFAELRGGASGEISFACDEDNLCAVTP